MPFTTRVGKFHVRLPTADRIPRSQRHKTRRSCRHVKTQRISKNVCHVRCRWTLQVYGVTPDLQLTQYEVDSSGFAIWGLILTYHCNDQPVSIENGPARVAAGDRNRHATLE